MHDYQVILSKIYDILRTFTQPGVELDEQTELVADLGLDSMNVIKLLVMTEDTFDISIPLNILPDVRTIKDFAEQLQQLLMEGQS
ncbi:MAG: acyl carrier protein [Deltaproteobacteria bacterium]|nr:MAG: acyl carrier protein [Deltaproteobacteria bacterium]